MTPNELATFLREEMPRIKRHAVEFQYKDALRSDEADLLSALDAEMVLLKRALYDLEDADFEPGDGSCLDDLRLVVGEVESHHSIPGG